MSLEINLEGKVAIVTGAGRGIGRAVAVTLAKAGADICVTARTAEQINKTAELVKSQNRRAVAVSADAAVAGSVKGVVDKTCIDAKHAYATRPLSMVAGNDVVYKGVFAAVKPDCTLSIGRIGDDGIVYKPCVPIGGRGDATSPAGGCAVVINCISTKDCGVAWVPVVV